MYMLLDAIKEVLTIIENKGYEAYIVGGFVRDYYLHKQSLDIDICTNATPKDIKIVFNNIIQDNEQYGNVVINYKQLNISITTYRQDIEYDNKRKPKTIKYINSLKEDLLRRDFTINTLCMDKDFNIIDLYHGIEDIDNKIIRVVGNPNIKFYEDPLRILRGIRFATTLDFNITNETKASMMDNKIFLSKLSYARKKEELDKIFASSNNKKGIELLIKLKLSDELNIKEIKNIIITDNYLGIWTQLESALNTYSFTKEEQSIIKETKELLKEDITNELVLYKHNIICCLIAAQIKNINKNIIINKYGLLPIKSRKDINITSEQICDILKINNSYLKNIYQDLEEQMIIKKLDNNYIDIKKYIIKKYK
jgi:tRNA nucleotidyltransferase (CCA-adding enzyme)